MQRQSFLNALDLKGLTMYKKEKVIFNFLDDFRSKMICNY